MITASISSIHQFTGWLDHVSGHWWFLAIIAAVALIDSVAPVLPSETTIIVGGVASGSHHYSIVWVIAVAAAATCLGDNIAYQLGRLNAPRLERRAGRRPQTRARLDWAEAQIRKRGGPLLITARFLPGGRTATTLSCGLTRQPRPWFIRWVALASLIRATYGALLGYVGGVAFQKNHTFAFLVGFVCAAMAALTFEVLRRRERHHIDVITGANSIDCPVRQSAIGPISDAAPGVTIAGSTNPDDSPISAVEVVSQPAENSLSCSKPIASMCETILR